MFAQQDFLQHTLDPNSDASTKTWLLNDQVTVNLYQRGIIRFQPKQACMQLVLSAGVHGDETAPIELLNELVAELLAGQVELNLDVLIIFAHPVAISQHTRFVDENLNRLFALENSQSDTLEASIALSLKQILAAFYDDTLTKMHLDLHTSIRPSKIERFAIHPVNPSAIYSQSLLQMLVNSDIGALVLSDKPSSTFSYYSSARFGAQALTLELGKVMPFGQNDLSNLALFKRTLLSLLTGNAPELDKTQLLKIKLFDTAQTVIRQQACFKLSFADNCENFSMFKQGEPLAQDGDWSYYSNGDEFILFPNAKVHLGHRALLMVKQITIDELVFA